MQPGHYCIFWTYLVKPDQVDAFIRYYGNDGEWAKLFRRQPSYLGTNLYRSQDEPDRFLTVDTWETENAFEEFKSIHWDDYQAMDDVCDDFTREETKLGQGDIPTSVRLG
ncbi:MAG: antibiotic biosynthesis monooxygenase family protein [Gammaproteobacteria bacterium]